MVEGSEVWRTGAPVRFRVAPTEEMASKHQNVTNSFYLLISALALSEIAYFSLSHLHLAPPLGRLGDTIRISPSSLAAEN